MVIDKIADTISGSMQFHFLGNSLRDYATCLVAILIGFLVVKVFQRFIIRRLRKWSAHTPSTWDDLLISTLEVNALPILYLLILFFSLRDLEMKVGFRSGLAAVTTVGVTLFLIRVALALVNHAIKSYWVRHGKGSATAEKNINGILVMAKILVWILGFILLLDNLGIKVSAFVAGLGITGIAVALAAQAILGDLFSYFVIFFDQPFEVGHTIKVDGFIGEVEHIGLKTTRLRSIEGEQIIVANKFLTDSRVQNFKRMHRRRARFTFEVNATTPTESLRAIPSTLKGLLTRFPEVTFERSTFKEFSPAGLLFETIYFLETPDYGRYMEIQQEVNLGLHEEFTKSGIEFAISSNYAKLAPKS